MSPDERQPQAGDGSEESWPSFNPLQQNPLTWNGAEAETDSQSGYDDSSRADDDVLVIDAAVEIEPTPRQPRQPLPRAARITLMLMGLVAIEFAVGVAALPWIWSDVEQDPGALGSMSIPSSAMMKLFAAAAFVGTPLVVLLSFGMRKFLDHKSIASMGWLPLTASRIGMMLAGLLLGAVPMLATAGIVLMTGRFQWSVGGFSWQFVWLIPILILAALKEEVVFRGYFVRIFWDDNKPLRGVFVSSILFWLIHLANPHALSNLWVGVNLFAAGLFLGMTYLISRDLYFPTAVHFAWNFTQGPILGIPVSGIDIQGLIKLKTVGTETWIHGGKFGLEASAFCTMVVGLMTAVMVLLWDSGREEIDPTAETDAEDSSSEAHTSEFDEEIQILD